MNAFVICNIKHTPWQDRSEKQRHLLEWNSMMHSFSQAYLTDTPQVVWHHHAKIMLSWDEHQFKADRQKRLPGAHQHGVLQLIRTVVVHPTSSWSVRTGTKAKSAWCNQPSEPYTSTLQSSHSTHNTLPPTSTGKRQAGKSRDLLVKKEKKKKVNFWSTPSELSNLQVKLTAK